MINKKRSDIEAIMNLSIETININSRSYKALKRTNIKTVSDLVESIQCNWFRSIKGIGQKSQLEIIDALRVLLPDHVIFEIDIDQLHFEVN